MPNNEEQPKGAKKNKGKEPWLARVQKRRKQARLQRDEKNKKKSLQKCVKEQAGVSIYALSESARQLYLQSIIDKHLSAEGIMVDASIVANLMLDIRKEVVNTQAEKIVEQLLVEANSSVGLKMTRIDLDHRLEQIQHRSAH